MSIVNRKGGKVVLPRIGPDAFWEDVRACYAGSSPCKWKYLAMLALKVNAGWSHDMIGNDFGHERGHVTRCLTTLYREMQERFEWLPELEDDVSSGES